MNVKKNGKVFTSKSVGTGPSSYEKRIYRTAVSQRLRNAALNDSCFLANRPSVLPTALFLTVSAIPSFIIFLLDIRAESCRCHVSAFPSRSLFSIFHPSFAVTFVYFAHFLLLHRPFFFFHPVFLLPFSFLRLFNFTYLRNALNVTLCR